MMAHPRSVPARRSGAVVLPCVALLVGYFGVEGFRLLEEYRSLRSEWLNDEKARVVGYPGVTPYFSHANGPPDWLHDEGDSTRLWAGWDRRAKRHVWFTVGKGEITADHLTEQIGKDTARAIDKPRLEARRGEIWEAIRPDDLVAAGEYLGVDLAYPLGVLDKTLVVNDEIHTQPLLVLFTPFVQPDEAVEAFYPILEGKRLTMGHSGYLWDRRPLLYDRQAESLWVSTPEGLRAIAGKHKGALLQRVAHLAAKRWGDWRVGHPEGRLVAGAIRDDLTNFKP